MDRIRQRHISEISVEYGNQRKMELPDQDRTPSIGVFGIDTCIQIMQRVSDQSELPRYFDMKVDYSDDQLSECQDILLASKQRIVNRYKQGGIYQLAAVHFFNECVLRSDTDPTLFKDLQQYSSTKGQINEEAGDQVILEMPDSLYFRMLKLHMRNFIEADKRFIKKAVPILRKNFLKLASAAITNGELPVELPTLITRVNETSAHLQDLLQSDSESIGGIFWERYGLILVGSQVNNALIEEVYGHEMVHALSGKTVLMQEGNRGELKQIRSGLQFAGWQARFFWLNEAITHNVIGRLRKEDKSQAYLEEREVLRLICEQGSIPPKLFEEAYFENYQPGRNPIPKWEILQNALTKAYGANFLVKVDKLMKEIGITKTLEILKRNAHDIALMRIPTHHPKDQAYIKMHHI